MEINQNFMFDGNSGTEYTNEKYNPNNYARSLNDIESVIIHCTATDSEAWDNPMALISYDLKPNHISLKGCPFATYHFYINKPGEVYQLVSMNYYTWHCKEQNRSSAAICINHGGIKNNVTDEQYKSLIDCIKYVFDVLEWQISERSLRYRLYFHRHFANKLCPGMIDYDKLIRDILKTL